MGETSHTEQLFRVEKEYARCVEILSSSGILTILPASNVAGVTGFDGNEYPMPTLEKVKELFRCNNALVQRKVPQGFDRLELTPMAMPLTRLIDLTKESIIRHAAEGNIFQTRHSASDSLIPVKVNTEKHIWIWENLRQVIDTDEMVYFPKEYFSDHGGQTKQEVITDRAICAIPGWSVGLVESSPFMTRKGEGAVKGGRQQPEVGLSPREYLILFQSTGYEGETGRTLEDFFIGFLTRLIETCEISNDRYDENASWLLGQYIKYIKKVRSDLIPTGWWNSDFGRLRLDCHRPGNKLCTRSWGAATTVRLMSPGPD